MRQNSLRIKKKDQSQEPELFVYLLQKENFYLLQKEN
jgi:hypothetical protein